MQISARTPASAAMHAVSLDYLSNGRLILGIGVSGPQVVEGWYGQPYPKPLARTREWVSIFRQIVAREAPVAFDGKHYQLPLPGGTGLGKPLKLILHPVREHIPVYLGAEGPKNAALGAEICDGWIPMLLSPYRMMDMYKDAMRIRNQNFEIAATVTVIMDDDVDRALSQIKQNVGFYVGGMGAKSFNVHKDHVTRMGFGAQADRVQGTVSGRSSGRSHGGGAGRTVRRDLPGGPEGTDPRSIAGLEGKPGDHAERRHGKPGNAALHGGRTAVAAQRDKQWAI